MLKRFPARRNRHFHISTNPHRHRAVARGVISPPASLTYFSFSLFRSDNQLLRFHGLVEVSGERQPSFLYNVLNQPPTSLHDHQDIFHQWNYSSRIYFCFHFEFPAVCLLWGKPTESISWQALTPLQQAGLYKLCSAVFISSGRHLTTAGKTPNIPPYPPVEPVLVHFSRILSFLLELWPLIKTHLVR